MASSSSSSKPEPEKFSYPPPRRKTLKIIGPNPEKNKPKYDFRFKLNRTTKFRQSIVCLADYVFNPTSMGLLQVNASGFSITVSPPPSDPPEGEAQGEGTSGDSIFQMESENVFGLLQLQAAFFDEFECLIPVCRMIDLEHVLLNLCASGGDDVLLTVYSLHGSNLVSFEFKHDDSVSAPTHISLLNDDPHYPAFPDISYGLEASIPSSFLSSLVTSILENDPDERPDFVTIMIHPSAVSLTVGPEIVRARASKVELWLNWQFWESLDIGLQIADKCYVYTVIDPQDTMMLVFKLSESDERVTFRRSGNFTYFNTISCLAFSRSLT